MGIFDGLLKTVVNVATLPIDIAGDVAQVVQGKDPKFVDKKVDKTLNDVGSIFDE